VLRSPLLQVGVLLVQQTQSGSKVRLHPHLPLDIFADGPRSDRLPNHQPLLFQLEQVVRREQLSIRPILLKSAAVLAPARQLIEVV